MTLEANRPASSIAVTAFHGIVVRKDALRAKSIPVGEVLNALEAAAPLDEDGELLSFGPSFGEEALHEFIRRLEALGLDYFTDYCTISADIPDWCAMRASVDRTK